MAERYTVCGTDPRSGNLVLIRADSRLSARVAQFALLRDGVRDVEVTDTTTGVQL